MVNQHWFRKWLGAVRHQAITWVNVDRDLCCHMASLGHNDLRWVTTKKQKWCQFLENLRKYSLKYIGFNHAKQIMGYHACFWDILTNITHEIRDKTTYYHPLGWVSDYGGLSYHFMSKLYSKYLKTKHGNPPFALHVWNPCTSWNISGDFQENDITFVFLLWPTLRASPYPF